LIAFLVKGGVVLIPIGILSVIALALIAERVVYFAGLRERGDDLHQRVLELVRTGNAAAAFDELERTRTPEARVLLAGLTARAEGQSDQAAGLRMETQALKHTAELERNVAFLSSIANLSTLLGLLGTVTGMLRAFLNLRISGISDPARLAGGISEALITTVGGLCVAIPCLFAFHLFRQRVNRALSRMEIASAELLALFAREKQLRIRL
jgi:biopolymer transport protein ExbB